MKGKSGSRTLAQRILGALSRPQKPVVIDPRSIVRVDGRLTATPCRAHLFERAKGGIRCKWCGERPAGARTRRHGGRRVRTAVPEKDVQRSIIALLVHVGCRYDKKGEQSDIWVAGTRRPRSLPGVGHRASQTPGWPDLFAFLPKPRWPVAGLLAPTCVWIEVKADDGVASDAQTTFMERCRDRGIPHVMGGYDAAYAFLERHGFLKGTRA
jgi:hypothetical protein